MEEEDEDIYTPDEDVHDMSNLIPKDAIIKDEDKGDDQTHAEEEGEEIEEDDSDSDIDIITERKDGIKDEPLQPQRVNVIRNAPQRTSSPSTISKSQPSSVIKSEPPVKAAPTKPGSSYPGIKTSKIDVDAKPIYEANGKPITEIDMDADFPEDDKPWRRPGTDITDYFNYGLDEFTWASYCLKQDSLRKDVADQKKQMEEMQSFLGMPGGMPMPGMPGPAAAQVGMPSLGGSGDLPPEMQQMMQQMMAQGMDPSQMDFSTFTQMMQGASAGMSAQGFGGPAGPQGQGQQMGYGYGAGSGGGGASGGNRNQGGRGQNRRNW